MPSIRKDWSSAHQLYQKYPTLKPLTSLLCRRHTTYGAKNVDITYNDRLKLLYYTINLGGQNTVENGQELVVNRQKSSFSYFSLITAQ